MHDRNTVLKIPGLDSDISLSCLGPWNIIERHEQPDVDFNLPWRDYLYGFGDASSDFWLGTQILFYLTKVTSYILRVDTWTFDGYFMSTEIDSFSVGDASKDYAMNVGSFIGGSSNASAFVTLYNQRPFATQDKYSGSGVPQGGWWFTADIAETFGWLTGPISDSPHGSQWPDRKGQTTVPVKKSIMRLLQMDSHTGEKHYYKRLFAITNHDNYPGK